MIIWQFLAYDIITAIGTKLSTFRIIKCAFLYHCHPANQTEVSQSCNCNWTVLDIYLLETYFHCFLCWCFHGILAFLGWKCRSHLQWREFWLASLPRLHYLLELSRHNKQVARFHLQKNTVRCSFSNSERKSCGRVNTSRFHLPPMKKTKNVAKKLGIQKSNCYHFLLNYFVAVKGVFF